VKQRTPFSLLVLCLTALVGSMSCAVPAQPGRVIERVDAAEVQRIVQYFGHVKTLSREALRREYAQQEAAFAHDRSDENRLRLAFLLGLPETDFSNPASALDLLQDYLNESEAHQGPFREIATLLYVYIQSNKQHAMYASLFTRLQEELRSTERQLMAQQQLSQKLQDELEAQRALAAALSKQLQEALSERERHVLAQQQLSKKLQDERKQVKKLQDQIERIKDIEKSLIEREQTGNKGT